MLQNYFVSTWRNLWRHKFFSLVNIVGLAIGISSSLVIAMIVHYEFSFDQFQLDKDRIYRIVLDTKRDGFEGHSAAVPAPLAQAAQGEITGIEQVIPIYSFPGDAKADVEVPAGSVNKKTFKKQESIIFTNSDYLALMGYKWLVGNPTIALTQPFQVVLTKSRAEIYFPKKDLQDVPGSTLRYRDIEVSVSGVVDDLEKITDFRSKEFISLPTLEKTSLKDDLMLNVWDDWMGYSNLLVKISPQAQPSQIEQGLNTILAKHSKKEHFFSELHLALQPLSTIHFDERYQGMDIRIAHKPTLYGLIAIAGFLLLLGCINYVNLSTAQASTRAKEVGIRKSIGGNKKQLVVQFLGETFFLTTFATVLSIIIIPLLLQAFSAFIPEGLTFSFLGYPSMLFSVLLIVLLVSVLAGLYPAFVLSGYNPIQVLKNQQLVSLGQSRQALLRKGLTVSQFVIAQFFVISTLIISKQIYFVLHADMGFAKEAILTFRTPRDTIATHRMQFKQRLQAIPGIASVSNGFLAPATAGGAFANVSYFNGKEELKPTVHVRWGDDDFLDLYNIPIIAGRNAIASDSLTEIVVNEQFAKEIGFRQPGEALGQFLKYNDKEVPIVGIVKNFHTQNLHAQLAPLIFQNRWGDIFHVKLRSAHSGEMNWQKTISDMEELFKENYPDGEFNYEFMEDSIKKFYEKEQATASLLNWATGLTILISCLGLLGLVLYTTNSRTKEVGIRKVLGASIVQLISLLAKDFIKLILIAFIVASPLAWWAAHRWLDNFAYKTPVGWWVFLVSGLGMLLLAVLLLSVQTFKAAAANPVNSLRDE